MPNIPFKQPHVLFLACEIKSVEKDDLGNYLGIIEGYATTNSIDLEDEIIEAGAFAESIEKKGINKIDLLREHDSRRYIGDILELRPDAADGNKLYIKAQVDLNISEGYSTFRRIVKGMVGGFSVGFHALTTENRIINGKSIRVITKGELLEVSVVDNPCNTTAELTAFKSQQAELEKTIKSKITEFLQTEEFKNIVQKNIEEFIAQTADKKTLLTFSEQSSLLENQDSLKDETVLFQEIHNLLSQKISQLN